VLDFAEVWFKQVEKITFHDPLAAVTLFDDQICAFERGDVAVELNDPDTFAMTRWTPSRKGKHEAAMQVNSERFFEKYFEVFDV
jgi:purine nucleosidase